MPADGMIAAFEVGEFGTSRWQLAAEDYTTYRRATGEFMSQISWTVEHVTDIARLRGPLWRG